MNRRLLLRLGTTVALLALPVTGAVARTIRRFVGDDAQSGGRLVEVGGPGGPVITVIPLPEHGFSGGDHLAG